MPITWNTVSETHLFYKQGTSDKEYIVTIQEGGSQYRVMCYNGRRGNAVIARAKGIHVTMLDATRESSSIIAEKKKKGYVEDLSRTTTSPRAKATAAPEESKIYPQLLNQINGEEANHLCINDAWGMQQKHDGTRLMVRVTSDGKGRSVLASNRLGNEATISQELERELLSLEECTLDGELVNGIFHVFDILRNGKKDISKEDYMSRYNDLSLFLYKDYEYIYIVNLYTGAEAKTRALAALKNVNAEGAVFKKLQKSPYSPGRPNSNGDQRKYKFYETASCIVKSHNAKRSVSLQILDGSDIVGIGNVTIPPNHKIPSIDSVVEIRYLYAYKNGSLYQPVYLGERDDIPKSDCTIEQLKYKQGQ